MSSRSLDVLVNFSRSLAAKRAASDDVKQLLVDSARELAGAAGAVFVDVDAHVGASSGVDAGRAAAAGATSAASTAQSAARFDLAAGDGALGSLVLYTPSRAFDDDAQKAVRALADIAAVALGGTDVEDARRGAEKLRALGGMAAGISHDLKNVFGPLLMQLDVLARKDDADVAFLKERLEKMRRPLERGLLIVERLRSFSRRSGSDEREVVDVHTVVDDAVGICRPKTVGTDVEIVVEPGDAPPVQVEVAALVAALTNVLTGAIDAVAHGKVAVTIGARDSGAIVDVVASGSEPFARDGLAMIRDFARRHGGFVELDSHASGARFSLWVPGAVARA